LPALPVSGWRRSRGNDAGLLDALAARGARAGFHALRNRREFCPALVVALLALATCDSATKAMAANWQRMTRPAATSSSFL
jgi:hypothetical protein